MTSSSISPISRFWHLLKPDKKEIRNVYIYSIFIGLLNLTLPVGIQAIINIIQGGAVNSSWLILVFFVTLGIALVGIMQVSQLRITENLQQKIFTRAAFEFAYRIPRVKLEKLFQYYAPELMNRFFDVISIQKGLTKILIDFSAASIQVVFGLILLSLYHPFFILFSILLLVMVLIIFRLTARKGLESSIQESKRKYQIAHWLQEVARANTTFKLAGKTNLSLEKVNHTTEQYIDARESHFTVLVRQFSLLIVFKVMVALGLLLIGGLLVIEQQMNIGQFVAAEIVILLMISSVEKLILSFETIYDVLTSLEKIGQVTDLELEKEGGVFIDNFKEGLQIELMNVNFQYPQENKNALNEISLLIKPGQRILVSGKNDSGKSTLLYMLAGLIKPASGYMAVNDIPIENYDFETLHSNIGGYLRDEDLFEGTLLENITLGRLNVNFEDVKWAIKNLGLEPLLKTLPLGYETKILPHGRQFSKSTVAKILIARVVVDKPKLLLFENSFAILSDEDREEILKFVLDPEHHWTVVISSSHDLGIYNQIETEFLLEKGRIVETKVLN
ncbi:MAG: ATP-binding cassette domain-containing protein [Flavobacteriales bacterium]|nr:ATP-binding cassette domain-containing protein [Flavobacteriales bacterium]